MIKVAMIVKEGQQKGKTKYKIYRNAVEVGYRELTPQHNIDGTRTSSAYAPKNLLHKVGSTIQIKIFPSTDWIRVEQFTGENVADFIQSIAFPQREQLARFTANSI